MTKMLNGKTTQILNNIRKGVGSHSVLITFACVTLGVGATIYFAQKEIAKAKTEVKVVRSSKTLTKAQKNKETVKCVVKNTWKTAVVAIGTILLVTGTSAITAANTAATVAGLSSTIKLADKKLDDYDKVDKIRRNVIDDKLYDGNNSDEKHWWIDRFTGSKFEATYKQIQAAAEITDLKIRIEGCRMIRDFYIELMDLGVIFDADDFPDYTFNHGWYQHTINGKMGINIESCIDSDGNTTWYIEYNEPSADIEWR